MILADLTNNTDVGFALGLAVIVLGIVSIALSNLANIVAWAVVVSGLALCLVWWPQ